MSLMRIGVLLLLPTIGWSVDLKDRFDPDHDRPEPTYMLSAPIVVVATVRSDDLVGPERPSARRHDVFLLLREITCDVEIVLKGSVAGGTMRFFYFALSSRNEVLAPHYRTRVGQRYIFFLMEDAGVFRSVGDAFQYWVPVFSGAHLEDQPEEESSIGTAIADVLLTPGTGYETRFCPLDSGAVVLSELTLTSKDYTIQLLKKSLSHPDLNVRVCACRLLVKYFPEQTDCISTLVKEVQAGR